jgi:hypothetical protein
MNLEGARRVMETVSHETANQYLRFGWTLINQYVVAATDDQPAIVRYVLASVRRIEDTRQVLILTEPDEVNEHLQLGWKLIDKHITAAESDERRDETLHFVLAWQSEEPPVRPGAAPESAARFDPGADTFDVDVDDVL